MTEAMDYYEKLQPAVTKATSGNGKSFNIDVLVVTHDDVDNVLLQMSSFFCYNRRCNLLQPIFIAAMVLQAK